MLDQCLDEEPLLIEAQLLKATFAEESGELAGAEQAYRRALYIDRNSAMAHFRLALLQRQQGDAKGVRRSFEIVQRLVGDKDPHVLVEYGDGMCCGRLCEMAAMTLDV